MTKSAAQQDAPVTVAVLGDGVAGAMAAAALARALPRPRYRLIIVPTGGPDESVGAFGAIEASSPTIRRFHVDVGMDAEAVVRAAAGSFALGAIYSGWTASQPSYFMPYGDIGATLGGVAFHQIGARLRAAGQPLRLPDFSMATLLAQAGRFARPSDNPRSPLSTYTYGMHVPKDAYAKLLLSLAETCGVIRSAAPYAAVSLAGDGGIEAIVLDGGERIEADFYIDASGPAALLMNAMPKPSFVSWRHWLPCDRAAERLCASSVSPAPYCYAAAHSNGWRRTVPARGFVGEALIYASDAVSEAEEEALLGDAPPGNPVGATRISSFEQGRHERPWVRNCVAIGSAAAVLEPLASTSLQLAQSALERLAMLFPNGLPAEVEAREYNRLMAEELDRTRDFAILRYKLNSRAGELFWDRAREAPVPDPLAHKIEQYRRRGRIPLLDGDVFDEAEWAVIFDECGVRPECYDLLADTIPLDQLKSQLRRMQELMLAALAAVPPHADYLERLGRKAAA